MKKALLAVAIGSLAVAPAAFGALPTVDVSAITDLLNNDGVTAITNVGAAMLGLAGIGIVFKWVLGFIF